MADTVYGVTKVNGRTATGLEMLGSRQEFITITTDVDIRTIAQGGSSASQAALDKLIEIVSLRGQPVIMGAVTGTYVLRLVNEHYQGWLSVQGVTDVQLVDRIVADGVNFTGYGTVSVVIADHLV
jgi:hypothetical protein